MVHMGGTRLALVPNHLQPVDGNRRQRDRLAPKGISKRELIGHERDRTDASRLGITTSLVC